jgi:hypothetical protein
MTLCQNKIKYKPSECGDDFEKVLMTYLADRKQNFANPLKNNLFLAKTLCVNRNPLYLYNAIKQ